MILNNKFFAIVVIIIALLLMALGTTIFYNTGLGITDLNVQKSDSNDAQYDISYMLRSVRGFNKVVAEYTLLTNDNQVMGKGSSELNKIKDGSFQMDDKINVDNNSLEAKKVEIKLYEIDESNTQKQIFDQTFDI